MALLHSYTHLVATASNLIRKQNVNMYAGPIIIIFAFCLLVAFLLWEVRNLRKKLKKLEEKQKAEAEKESCKDEGAKQEADLEKLEEELLVKLKETKKLNVRRTPLSVMLERDEKKG